MNKYDEKKCYVQNNIEKQRRINEKKETHQNWRGEIENTVYNFSIRMKRICCVENEKEYAPESNKNYLEIYILYCNTNWMNIKGVSVSIFV